MCFGQEISGAAKSADGKANLPSSSTGIADLPPSANSYFTANGVQFYRPERFRTSRESYGARTSFGVNESAGEAVVGAGMVLPTAHRQGANVDGAETFGVLFGKELALVLSRNGHDWPNGSSKFGCCAVRRRPQVPDVDPCLPCSARRQDCAWPAPHRGLEKVPLKSIKNKPRSSITLPKCWPRRTKLITSHKRALFCTVVHRFPQKKRARPLAKKMEQEYSRDRLSREA